MRRIWIPAAAPLAALMVGSVLGTLHGASAQSTRTAVVLGEVSAPTEVESTLRTALREELSNVSGIRVTRSSRARWVLRGSITRLDVVRDGDRNEIECEVSLVMAERGNVRMMLSGRAAARGAHVERLTESAVRAAVHGALRPLGETLGRR